MTLYQFNLLEEAAQFKVLDEYKVIAWRRELRNKYFLYQVERFYVEMKCTNRNQVIGLRTFSTSNLLEPYLDKIDISGIINNDKA